MRLGLGLGIGGQRYVPSFDQIIADGNTLGRWRYDSFEEVPQHLAFVSTNEAYVDLGADTLSFANGQSDFSIIAYLKDDGSGYNAMIFEFADNLPVRVRYSLTYGIYFEIYDGEYHTIYSTLENTSGWCMVVCTLEIATKRMTYWVNGQYIGETFLNNLNFIINRSNYLGKDYPDTYYSDCKIGKVAICDYVLTDSQIQSLTHPNIINTSPIHYWDFHEGTGTALEDVVGGVDGTIVNATWGDRVFGQLTDLSGNDAHMTVPATTSAPTLNPDHISFNGVNDVLTTGNTGWEHPLMVYIVVNQNTWGIGKIVMGSHYGSYGPSLRIMQYGAFPDITMSYSNHSYLEENVIGVKQCLIQYREASDGWMMKNNNEETKTLPGTLYSGAPQGLIFGGVFNGSEYDRFTDIDFYEMIIRQGEDSANDITAIYQYLNFKYSIT
jgi:hypothetical protein